MADSSTITLAFVGNASSALGAISAVNTGLNSVEGTAGKALGALGNLALGAAKLAVAVGAITFAGVAAGMTSAVTVAASFEQQLSSIAAVSSKAEVATVGGMKAIGEAALQLGKDTSFSATEAAAGMEEMVKAGVSLTDVMGGGAKAALDLAAAGALSVAEAATVASNAMNAFGLSGKDLPHIADALAGAAVASATDVHQLGFALASVGAVAHTIGLSFDDTTTAIASFAQAGLKGSDAGTSFKTMLLNLTPTTKAQIATFKELGIITADGSNQFFDAAGNVKNYAGLAGVLKTAMVGLTKEQQINALQTMFGTDAVRAAAIMAELGAEGANKMAEAQKAAGGAAAIANERLNNLRGSLEKLGGTWEVIRIKLGAPFLPVLKRGVDALTEALNKAEPAITAFAERAAAGFDKLITRGTKAAPAFLAAGAGLLAFGRQGMALVQGALPMLVEGFERIRGLFSADAASGVVSGATSLVGGLIGAFQKIAPIAVAVGGAIVTNIIDTFRFLETRVLPPLVSIVQQTGAVLLGTLLPAAAQTGAVMRGIFGDALDWLARTVWPPFLSIVTQTSNFFTGVILPTLPGIATALRTALGETVQWLAVTVWPALTAAATLAWGYISGTIVPAIPGVAATLRSVLGGALEWIGTTGWPMLVAGARIASTFITGTLVPALTVAVEWLGKNLPPAISWITTTGWPALVTAGEAVSAWVVAVAIPALTQLADWLGPNLSDAVTWITATGWPLFVTTAAAVSDWIVGVAVPALSQLWDWLSPKLAAALEWLTTTGWPMLVTAATAVSDWVTATAIPALTSLVDWLGPKISTVVTWIMTTGWPTLVTAGEAVSTWITDTAVPALTEFIEWLDPKMRTAVTWIYETGWPEMVRIGGELNTMWQDAIKWAGELWTKLAEVGVWTDLTAAADKLWAAGKILNEVFGSDAGATEVMDAFVGLIKGASAFIYYFAAGVEAIATGLKNVKDAASEMPEWLVKALQVGAAFTPGGNAISPFLPQPSAPPAPGGSSGTTNQSSGGPIDNSSRESFVRTAYPHMLQAAGGDKNLAEMMLAAAISENGDVGKGGGFVGNNFFGIKGVGPAGSFNAATWEQEGGQRVNQNATFAAYNNPVEGFQGFMQFLESNPRYAGALQAYRQSGNAEGLFQGINQAGYATDPNWASTVGNIRRNQVAPVTAGLPSTFQAQPMSSQTTPLNGVNLSQTQQQWSQQAADANSICGPYLASLFTSATGRPPTPEEARQLGAKMGIYQGGGILNAGGFDEYATQMIREINPGSTATVQQTPFGAGQNAEIQAMAAEQLAGGSPIVGFNTAGHYFGADAFDTSTGKFHVGGTGQSLRGGSDWMTVAEMEAAMGQVSDVITIVGAASTTTGGAVGSMNSDFKGAAGVAGETAATIDTLGVAASAGATQLAAIGTSLAPVVAQMDTGVISVGAMTDAIIAQAAQQGVGAESAAQYANGLIGQDAALRGVLAGFAATTPAAADLLTQLDAGTISSDQAAIAFAGLATTTATAGAGIVATATAVGVEVPAQFGIMQQGAQAAIDLMSSGALTSVTDMGTGTLTTVQDMAGNTIATVTDMQGEVVSQSATLANGVSLNLDDMSVKSTRIVDEMAGTITTVMTDTAGNSVKTVTDMSGKVVAQFSTIGAGADAVPPAVKRMGDSWKSLPTPNVSNIVSEFKKIEKSASDAMEAVNELGEHTGSKSGSGKNSGLGKKAAGGLLSAGVPVIVGDGGRSELFVPGDNGYLYPSVPKPVLVASGRSSTNRSGGEGLSAADIDKLVKAIAAARPLEFTQNITAQASPGDLQRHTERALRKLATEWEFS